VAKTNRGKNKNYRWRKNVVLSNVNGNRNRRHNKILRKTLVRKTRPKRHFRYRSAR